MYVHVQEEAKNKVEAMKLMHTQRAKEIHTLRERDSQAMQSIAAAHSLHASPHLLHVY